ncbi:MAG: hypothetical protein NWE98_11620 [Candidatus Bathyarchaeota archaeon]|nr:hypothetical protein [Candidatus Bathyarchaeota archaeon]
MPIRIRLDVDYPFESRVKSILAVALRRKSKKSKNYLRNARIIARMINESPKQVKAYWFFTPYTIPDKRLLNLLNPEKHEVALHVATEPYREWKILENESDRTVKYYTIHGTNHPFMRLLWGRKLSERQAKIPSDFPLKSLHDEETFGKTFSLDSIAYSHGRERGKREVEAWIKQGFILSAHPEWLFKGGSRRGPYYDILKDVLEVDQELDVLSVRKRFNVKTARSTREYEQDINVDEGFLDKLSGKGIDIFTFLERKWCHLIPNPPRTWVKEEDNVGMLEIKNYELWWQGIGKKTRNMVRKAQKDGVKISVVEPNDKLAEGIWKIYNETPIRQERAFPHYNEPLKTVKGNMYAAKNSTFIAANLGEEVVGFIQILYGDQIAIISNILSLQQHWDKALNNAMLAKAVEVCASNGNRWLMYGRMGNHPSLDRFKASNGFIKYPITRFYVPLTNKGKIAIRLGLHRELKDALPQSIKNSLIPVFNWVSRTKVRLRQKH